MSETYYSYLEYHSEAKNSHKFYEVTIDDADPNTVNTRWGRIGSYGQTQETHCADPGEAIEAAQGKVYSKKAKGYRVQESRTGDSPRVTVKVKDSRPAFEEPIPTTFSAQLAEPLELTDAGQFIINDEWAVEQKLDGHRLLLLGTGHGVKPLNRNGGAYAGKSLPPHLNNMLLPDGIIIDGELMDLGTLEFWAFDMRNADGTIDAQDLTMRRQLLTTTIDTMNLPVRVLPQATTAETKQALVEQAIQNNSEGVVFKHIPTPYREGRNTAWRKVKFVATCDAIVTGVNDDGKESMSVGLLDGDRVINVGRASLIGRPEVAPGEVVELKYLYATDDNRLYQPVMVRKRTDKTPGECTIDQLRYTDRSILAV